MVCSVNDSQLNVVGGQGGRGGGGVAPRQTNNKLFGFPLCYSLEYIKSKFVGPCKSSGTN